MVHLYSNSLSPPSATMDLTDTWFGFGFCFVFYSNMHSAEPFSYFIVGFKKKKNSKHQKINVSHLMKNEPKK